MAKRDQTGWPGPARRMHSRMALGFLTVDRMIASALPAAAIAASGADRPSGILHETAAATLVTIALLILLFGTFFVVALRRRRVRMLAPADRPETTLPDAWTVAAERIRPMGRPRPVDRAAEHDRGDEDDDDLDPVR